MNTSTLPAPAIASHTPGPWTACSGESKSKYNIECNGVYNDCVPVATLKGPDREANARLISASPTILAALARLVKAVEEHRLAGVTISSLDELCDAEDQARAAIAKATAL